MPVEIRELIIRAVTTMDREGDEDSPEDDSLSPLSGKDESMEAIIQECVRQVLRILRKEKER